MFQRTTPMPTGIEAAFDHFDGQLVTVATLVGAFRGKATVAEDRATVVVKHENGRAYAVIAAIHIVAVSNMADFLTPLVPR